MSGLLHQMQVVGFIICFRFFVIFRIDLYVVLVVVFVILAVCCCFGRLSVL